MPGTQQAAQPDPARPDFKSWQEMLEWMAGLLLRRTGHGVPWWVDEARGADLPSQAATCEWLQAHGVAGYAQSPVMWELFGYPDFFLKDAAELLDGQYADRPHLRPIADAVISLVLAWAGDGTSHAVIQMRKTFISLNTPRRKFAHVAATSKSAVDIFLRLDEPAAGVLEAARAAPTMHSGSRSAFGHRPTSPRNLPQSCCALTGPTPDPLPTFGTHAQLQHRAPGQAAGYDRRTNADRS